MTFDYTVIGAGISGMTCALILARNGFNVALIEKSGKVAPTIRGFSKYGVFFDTGFHYAGGLGPGEPLNAFFNYLGLSGKLDKLPFDDGSFDIFRCVESGFEFRYPCGYKRIVDRFYDTFPTDKEAIDEYFRAVRKVVDRLPYINFDFDSHSLIPSESLNEISLKEFLDKLTDNQLLKCILSMHCLLHGVPPEEVPFAYHASIVAPYYESVNGISGGGLSIANACEEQLNKLGVSIICGQGVKEILFTGDVVSGILLENGTHLRCNACISTIHPHALLNIVPETYFRPAYRKRVRDLEETTSACICYGISDAPVEELKHGNQFVFPGMTFPDLERDSPPKEKPLYITATGQSDEGQSRHGFIVIQPISCGVTERWKDSTTHNRPKDYYLFKENVMQETQHYVEEVFPGISGHIIESECATPLTLRDFTNSPYGSLYGVKHRIGQYNPIPLTKLKGLFLAGQAITAPGVMGAMVSGFLVCGYLLGQNTLREGLKRCL